MESFQLQTFVYDRYEAAVRTPASLWLLGIAIALLATSALLYTAVYVAAPVPRAPRPSEYKYTTIAPDSDEPRVGTLPCWHDHYLARKSSSHRDDEVEPAEVFMSVVVPAYNEQDRLGVMLEEAVEFLNDEYTEEGDERAAGKRGARQRAGAQAHSNGSPASRNITSSTPSGWEILVVSDGSTDATVPVALDFARKHPGGSIRVISLERNRGKGGAVTHGMRHARGSYVVFADADGASRFADLGKLVAACRAGEDARGRCVAVGSRAHLVGSDAVVKRSMLRNFLMHSFHVLLRLLTPPATSRIKDTQCGFKLFSRAALPDIVPHMHSEGWIFDVEMLMLAESAQIPMMEVQIGWKEVKGSKLNVVWDSLGMAWGLAVLRAAWAMKVYSI